MTCVFDPDILAIPIAFPMLYQQIWSHHMGPEFFEMTIRSSVMVITLLSINSFLGRPIIESLLFSLALSIGLTPQLLPVIITVSLARGAKNRLI